MCASVPFKETVDIPQSLKNHLPARTYLVTAHARHGKYVFREASKLTLDWSMARLMVMVRKTGTVKVLYPTSDPPKTDDQTCSEKSKCEGPVPTSLLADLTMTASSASTWSFIPNLAVLICANANEICTLPSATLIKEDTTVEVTFP